MLTFVRNVAIESQEKAEQELADSKAAMEKQLSANQELLEELVIKQRAQFEEELKALKDEQYAPAAHTLP